MAELRGRDRPGIPLALLLTRAAPSLIAALTLVYRVVLASTGWQHVCRLSRDICTCVDRDEVGVRRIVESVRRRFSFVRVFLDSLAYRLPGLP